MPRKATNNTSPRSHAPPPHENDASMTEQERKRLRNRLSQQAFRRRQAERIRELSSRFNTDQKPDDERVQALQKENRQLRAQLVEVQTKLSRLIANIQGLNESVSKALDDTDARNKDDSQENSTTEEVSSNTSGHKGNLPSMDMDPFDTSIFNFDAPLHQQTEVRVNISQDVPWAHASKASFDDTISSAELINIAGTNPLYTQIPNIWSFEYQTGVEPYQTAMDATRESNIMRKNDLALSNSPFSDHIQLLQRLLKTKLTASGFIPEGQPSMQGIYQPVLMVLSMFNSITRPDVMAWYAKTRFFHIIELTAWQLYPSAATFDKLHQRYRPTDAQMKHPHPRVIDWIPFPSIRDRLIQLHSANPRIDEIFCDAVTGYVVETTMSDLILGAPRLTVYIRVTDLITAMSSGDDPDPRPAALPAPDVTTLFSSPPYARAAFKQLNMDKGASYYKIDPAFYAKYPELFDHSNDLTATGIPLRPKSQKVLTYPKPLDSSTVETYKSFIDFSLDAASTINTTTSSSSSFLSTIS